jgi:hypothetical protein
LLQESAGFRHFVPGFYLLHSGSSWLIAVNDDATGKGKMECVGELGRNPNPVSLVSRFAPISTQAI